MRSSAFKVATCFMIGLSFVSRLNQVRACDLPVSTSHDSANWVSEAERLIDQLADMAQRYRAAQPPPSFADLRDHPEKYKDFLSLDNGPFGTVRPDKTLWRLWLETGMPPLLRRIDESMHEYLRRNTSAYRKFVCKNKDLSEEAIHRAGMNNAISSIGSPLWYMTLQYLRTRCNLWYHYVIDVRSTPSSALETVSLDDKASYERMSRALSNWIAVNKSRMMWDSARRRFRPQGGAYLQTDTFICIVVAETSQKQNERASDERRDGEDEEHHGEQP